MHREDMAAKLSSVSGFVGRLVKIQYASGQPCAQLLFQTAHGPRLSLNRNIHVLQALAVGETYRVEGARREVSGKLYWHEPAIKPVPQEKRFMGPVRVAGVALVLGLAIAVVLLVRGHRSDNFAIAESVSGRTRATQAASSKSAVPDSAATASQAAAAHTPNPTPVTQKANQAATRKNTTATPGQSSATTPAAAAPSATVTPPASSAPPATDPAAPPTDPTTPVTDPTPPTDPVAPDPTQPTDPPADPTPPNP